MILTENNYHSTEARNQYMSVSRYKEIAGCDGILACSARHLAMNNKEWEEKSTPAMTESSYIDAHFSGTLTQFKGLHPELLKKDGALLAKYVHMEKIIARIERDKYFMQMMSGEKQVILTAEWMGLNWSIMIDSYIKDVAIVDLKVMANLKKGFFIKDIGFVSFVHYYGYIVQLAIYQKVVEINTGKQLPCYIAAASKEKPESDIEIIGFNQGDLKTSLDLVKSSIPYILRLKSGEEKPERCEICDYCRSTKVLSKPIHYSDITERI